jgi:hypothetical protein
MEKAIQKVESENELVGVDDEVKGKLLLSSERIKVRLQLTAQSIAEIGLELIYAKKLIGHGNFLKWIDSEFQMNERTARNFMNVAKELGEELTAGNLSNISAKCLYLLAAPSTSQEVREDVIERAKSGEPVTVNQVEALRKRHDDTLARLKEEKERFREVSSQRDKFKAAVEKLNKDIESGEEQISALKEQLKKAKAKPSSKPVEVSDVEGKIKAKQHELNSLKSLISNYDQNLKELDIEAALKQVITSMSVVEKLIKGIDVSICKDSFRESAAAFLKVMPTFKVKAELQKIIDFGSKKGDSGEEE